MFFRPKIKCLSSPTRIGKSKRFIFWIHIFIINRKGLSLIKIKIYISKMKALSIDWGLFINFLFSHKQKMNDNNVTDTMTIYGYDLGCCLKPGYQSLT